LSTKSFDPYIGVPDPNDPNTENSGFAMIWNYSTLAPGNHTIKVRLHNQDEEAKDSDASVTVVKFHGDFEVDSASYQRCSEDI
jgi:hypothetical protein